jgi:serine/threonine protein kinase
VTEVSGGTSGIVQLVEDKAKKRQLIVKRIECGASFDTSRFVREVSILGLLNHPCIIRIVGVSLPDANCRAGRIATEFASTGSVEDAVARIKNGETPSFWTHETVSCLIVGFVLGMKYLHSRNVIHRDLRPANLRIDDHFRIRISDFGFAVFESFGATLTRSEVYAYAAPEAREGEEATTKVDVFSFGLILYELLVGENVFPKSMTLPEIRAFHKAGKRPVIPDSVSKPVAELIEKCWSSEPELRPSFEEIYERLEQSSFPFFEDVPPEVILNYVSEVKRKETEN